MSAPEMKAETNALTAPILHAPRRLGADWTMFNAWAPLPGLGAIARMASLSGLFSPSRSTTPFGIYFLKAAKRRKTIAAKIKPCSIPNPWKCPSAAPWPGWASTCPENTISAAAALRIAFLPFR